MPFTVLLFLFITVAIFTDVVIFFCRFYRLPLLPVAVFSVADFTVAVFFPRIVKSNENFKLIQNPGFLPDHPKIKSLVVCAIPDITSKFQKDLSITF